MNSRPGVDVLRIRWILTLAGLVALALGLYAVFAPFLVPLVWALILVLTTWPLYRFVLRVTGQRRVVSASIMTMLQTLVLLAAVVPMIIAVSGEVELFARQVNTILTNPNVQVPPAVASLPIVGPQLEALFEALRGEREQLVSIIQRYQGVIIEYATLAAKEVFGAIAKIFMCLFAVYFFYLNGASWGSQVTAALHRVGGERFDRLLAAVRLTVRGAVYGVVATAFAQGFLAGIGYFVSGAPTPLLLGFATVVMSLLPFGTPFVYTPVAIYLLLEGQVFAGIGLFVWGVAVVSTVDNILRPFFISQATQLSILMVFIGVIGGLMSFGLVGIFIGPAIIAVTQVLWTEWVEPLNVTEPQHPTS